MKKLALEERIYHRPARGGGTASATPLLRRSVFLVALAASLLLASVFGAEDACACSCVRLSLEEQVQRSDAIFSGEVLDTRDNPSPTAPGVHLGPVTFDVEESWKGVSEEQGVILGSSFSAMEEGDCGIDFREGERYLIYSTYGGQGEDRALTTGICEGTKPLKAADDDLEALGPAELELPETEEEPDESKIQEVLEAVSGGEDGLITVQEGPGIYSTYDPKDKDKGKEKAPKKEKNARNPGGGTETGGNKDGGLPGTGGVGGATLLVSGTGALLVVGILVRRYLR